jgi:GDPmannose 4,6-dehydratase
MRCALITGITGQDGSYLAELLLEKEYYVTGIVRRTSMLFSHQRIDHIRSRIDLVYGDLNDGSSLNRIIGSILQKHDESGNMEVLEIYNLGAQTHVQVSFDVPEYTADVDALGTLRVLEVIRNLPEKHRSKIRFYQAGTSEMFGKVLETPQKETTPFNPVSPYACAKVYSHYITKNYREGYGLFACNGILFNHESPRRGKHFVTKKIVDGVKKIISGEIDFLELGNLDSTRDWGHAKDYVKGMWLMLQQDKPDDYILSTGVTTSVRKFVEMCFKRCYKEIAWQGEGLNEVAYDPQYDPECKRPVIKINAKYFRPCEVDALLGDSSKARKLLGWTPRYNLELLVKEMMMENK